MGCGVRGVGCAVCGVRCAVCGVRCAVWGVGCGVWGVGFGGWGVVCGVWGVGGGGWGVGPTWQKFALRGSHMPFMMVPFFSSLLPHTRRFGVQSKVKFGRFCQLLTKWL